MARLRVRRTAARLVVGGTLAALAGCAGAPPQPLPTAPPGAPSGVPSAPAYPSLGVSGFPPSALPSAGLPGVPPGGLPTGVPPTFATPPTITAPPTTTPPPSPAGPCTKGPTGQQVLALINGKPGIPDSPLKVDGGPFCEQSWQFTTVRLASEDAKQDEPLFVVSRGKPNTLRLVEAGADVCSDQVQADAPPGIRVRACGS
ncbi:hypothetical protein [Krasilnikovia sp. MM14-A1004]|uniref:hypothetical protein n=1 Tax=Krasilnikovia sp. MM14-A1004 TaxID=3373541 RepID=UPI00399CB5A5